MAMICDTYTFLIRQVAKVVVVVAVVIIIVITSTHASASDQIVTRVTFFALFYATFGWLFNIFGNWR